MSELDRVIHEPARLLVVAVLAGVEEADFLYLMHTTGLTKGNLSTHLSRLEEARYVRIEKAFRGKIPLTLARLTPGGLAAFRRYRKDMTELLRVRRRGRRGAAAHSLSRRDKDVAPQSPGWTCSALARLHADGTGSGTTGRFR